MSQSQSNIAQMVRQARRAHDDGDLGKAERLYAAVLERDPAQFDALHLLGMLNYQRGRLDAAAALIRTALSSDRRRVDGLCDLGLVLYASQSFADALAAYEAAARLAPDDPDVHNGCGVVLLQLERPTEALASFDRALGLEPGCLDALGNRGNVLLKLNRPEEAVASYEAGLTIAPNHPRLLTNQAIALCRLDRLAEATLCIGRALAAAPGFAEARFVESLVRLAQGDFERGWKIYESRWGTNAFAPHRRSFTVPLWLGDRPLAGRTILLHAEQGFGDTLQFVRYIPQVARLGARIVLEVQSELVRLLAGTQDVETVIPRGGLLPRIDLHCPLMSLPLALGTSVSTIPADVPYLSAPEPDAAVWRERLPARHFRVGLVWAGDKMHRNDANRSMRLEQLRPLFDLPQFQFVSLQQEVCAADAEQLRHHPQLLRPDAPFRDFAETAAVVSQLDAVVAVDTAVAHLAGAMGKPLLIMLPFAADFRWLRERPDSPWYPTARLIRQHRFGDWSRAVDLLRLELLRLDASHRREAPILMTA